MQFKDWLNVAILVATIAAIIIGPIAAVRITVRSEMSREKLRRKYETFHALMRTRRVTLSLEHVYRSLKKLFVLVICAGAVRSLSSIALQCCLYA